MKKLVLVLLALAAILLAFSPKAFGQSVVPNPVEVYLLGADNSIRVKSCVQNFGPSDQIDMDSKWMGFNRKLSVNIPNENLLGIDFRPADGLLYGVTDARRIYTIDIVTGQAQLISGFSPNFAAGFQSLMDFNPVVDAIRLMGGNDQNIAVVKDANGIFGPSAVQTNVNYPLGDVNFGSDPNLVGGAYTNNFVGATTTIFYGLDFNLDTFVTIAVGANGSSATGTGQLTTIGRVVNQFNNVINLSPTADMDIITLNGVDYMFGITGNNLFTVDLSTLIKGQPVFAQSMLLKDGGFIDIAVRPSWRCR